MHKIKLLEDCGVWGKKGEVHELSDDSTNYWLDRDKVQIIEYLGKIDNSPYFVQKKIRVLEHKISLLRLKLEQLEKVECPKKM